MDPRFAHQIEYSNELRLGPPSRQLRQYGLNGFEDGFKIHFWTFSNASVSVLDRSVRCIV